jgi:NAD(P)-dependent dehydrogenase (short-subunit alcohol dehydrogenase family)
LIGAARIYEAVDFADPNVSSWRRTLTATLDATAFPAIAAVREMKTTGGGRIVLISSSDTIKSEPEVAPYNAAKAAVGALVRSIVVDCTRNGIQANAVAPGWVYTPMVASYIDQSAPRSSSMVVKRYERRCRNRRRPHHIGPVLAQGVTTLPLNHHCMSPS